MTLAWCLTVVCLWVADTYDEPYNRYLEDHKRRMNRLLSLPMFAGLEEEVLYKGHLDRKDED
jgi:hypothetical protein